jgi:crotonobetainyl-CoA:carnitine CoA-transferase CaiB-like acyl-CoA transferase
MTPTAMIEVLWNAVGGPPELIADLELARLETWLGGPLAVDALAVGAVSSASLAAAELAEARGAERPIPSVSGEHVALSFQSERHVWKNDKPAGAGFSALSRFFACETGWVRTHGNYPHHASALARALEVEIGEDQNDTAQALSAAIGRRTAVEVEESVVAQGGCASAVRSAEEWRAHPGGEAGGRPQLVQWDQDCASLATRTLPTLGDRTRPATGIRVLDLTRVIAGPVAGRTLAALGAEVLRIDPPDMPELPGAHLDTGPGKRSAYLDLSDVARREALLADADVLLTGYRPGALARFGLDAGDLATRHPGLVCVRLSAWGTTGAWADRRGFDSLVQAATGIAVECATEDGTPGALPAQALDHATGHLMAAAALRGIARRARGEQIVPARLALSATASTLLAAPRPDDWATDATGRADAAAVASKLGDVTLIAPPGRLSGTPLRWSHGPHPLGADPPSWLP